MDNYQMYESQADSINVDDITSDTNNKFVLSRLKRNYAYDILCIRHLRDDYTDEDDEEDCVDYCPEGSDDMGWLGYFVGQTDHLQELNIRPFIPPSGSSVGDLIDPFFRGVSRNKSIREIAFHSMDLLGGRVFTMLYSFFTNNHNLTNIVIEECDFGDEGARLFALAIGSSRNKSLQKVELYNNNISEEGMVDIITALSQHPYLNYLDSDGNCLRKNGCVALATLLRCSANKLQRLDLSNTEINNAGIEALVPALATCSHLEELQLCSNPSISTRGWQNLATILEVPNSKSGRLDIAQNNIDDEAVASFANALANNRTLHTLYMRGNPSITNIGWKALSKLLCNTSSVNATFLSNHTLHYLGQEGTSNAIIGPLLSLNRRDDKKAVAVIKVLQSHADFDMLPFFEWEFKCLPLALRWLERASEYNMPRNFDPNINIERRKLSTIYQFVRGLPLLYVETCLRKELEDIKEEQQTLEERKMNIMRRLGRL